MARIVVVGAGLAGLRAAEALRARGWRDELALVGAEQHPPYNRPPLTKEALREGVDVAALAFRPRRAAADLQWRLGRAVTAVDLDARTVTGADGERLGWDGLVLATGLRSRRLAAEVSGAIPQRGAGRHAIRTADDAAALRAELLSRPRLAVLGAGFVGCEVAATARALGCEVDVVAPEAEPMQRPLGAPLGRLLRELHESHGVRFHLGRFPTRLLEAGGRTAGVRLDDGTELPAGVVVEALGSLPNTGFLAGTGLDLTDGVRTDNALRALAEDGRAHPRVVALGDLARFPNPRYGAEPRRVEHWNLPAEQARRAAATLLAGLREEAADETPFAPLPSFWSDQYGVSLQSFGAPELADELRALPADAPAEVFGCYRDGALVAALGLVPLGDPRSGVMGRLLQLRTRLLAEPALSRRP